MDGNRADILTSSNKSLSKLHLLAVFFDDELIYKIYLRSQVIHKLFESNPELDINKLELFHVQFSAPLTDLLKKIKKNNEKNVNLLYDEIVLNKDLIVKITESVFTEDNFKVERQRQALKINQSLRRLYQILSEDLPDYPFSKNINIFSSRFSQDFFYDITTGLLDELISYAPNEVYTNAYATIERRLMGSLNKHDFKTEFFCGLKAGNLIIEVYKIIDKEIYYLYYPSRNLFLFCTVEQLHDIDRSTVLSRNTGIIQELRDKNDLLESRTDLTRSFIPQEIRELLAENYRKISDINYLHNISSFEVQANILKTMLNTGLL